MIRAILWDIGGVLLSDPRLENFWQEVPGSKTLRTAFGTGQLTEYDFIKKGSTCLGVGSDEFIKKYRDIYCDIREISPVAALLKSVVCDNYVLSDTNPVHGEYVRKNFVELFKSMKEIYFSHDLGMRKNSPQVFQEVSKRMGVVASEILFIDNNELPIENAKKAGFATHLYSSSEKLEDCLLKLGLL